MFKTRKIISFLLTVILVAPVILRTYASDYTDVGGLDFDYNNAVNWVTDNGYMNGTSSTTFEPNTTLNRAMFVTILYRYAGQPSVSGITSPFSDVPSGQYYTNPVLWAYSVGVVQGTSPTTFSPNSSVTNEQIYTFLYRYENDYLGHSIYNLYPTDNEALAEIPYFSHVSSYAKTPVKWAVSNGILKTSAITSGAFYSTYAYRKDAALYFTRFNSNIDLLNSITKRFRFNNIEGFKSNSVFFSRYCATAAHKVLLANKVQNIASTDVAALFGNSYTGSCFGMNLALILDITGQIDFNRWYGKNTFSMYDLRAPVLLDETYSVLANDFPISTTITTSESAIHYLFWIQSDITSLMYENSGGSFYLNDENHYSKMNSFILSFRYSGIGLLNIAFQTSSGSVVGHSVIVVGPPHAVPGSTDSIYFNVFDPDISATSNPFKTLQITNTPNNTTAVLYPHSETIISFAYISDFSILEHYDLDGPQNNNPQ